MRENSTADASDEVELAAAFLGLPSAVEAAASADLDDLGGIAWWSSDEGAPSAVRWGGAVVVFGIVMWYHIPRGHFCVLSLFSSKYRFCYCHVIP